ncbi:MAG TPA: ATP-binding cassette domain-containing protein, partial [bacterium]|nr:ATP-binding cassette domain-containing protein [bacterium]
MNNEKVIEILGLYVKYDDKTVLENINLEVYKNDFIGIIGPNGGGKSSLLKTILGLLPIAGGKISVFGNTPETGRKYIGYVPQENKFDWKYPIKVLDVVLSGRLKFKKNFYFYNKSDKKKAEETLDKLGMLKLKN